MSGPLAPTPRPLSLTPEVCVCVLSCQRLDLLRTTLHSVVSHLESDESSVAYELVWVDNGSDEADRQRLHSEFHFEKALFLGTNYGMAYGFNTLFFRLCSARYFLTLEEDWEWVGARHGAANVLRDAITVLQHEETISGVFLRPDTLDQFLTRSAWRHTASTGDASSSTVDAYGRASSAATGVEYATYCMDRQAAYLWGAYSNGPGLYDRVRLQQLVGRQYGEPADPFPDPASESNYAYRVGAAGLCSAILRVWPGCEGVHECNERLFRHIGHERSHDYGKGRKPEVRWVLHGSNHSYDRHIVQLRALDVDPSHHWLSMYLTHGEQPAPTTDGGRIAVLVAARATSLGPLVQMARSVLAAAHSPELLELLWLLPAATAEGADLATECLAASATLRHELATRAHRPVLTRALGGQLLRCIAPPRDPSSLAERFALLGRQTDAKLLWLCPRLIASIVTAPRPAVPPFDQQVRAHFIGDGDVRSFVKDRLLLLQLPPARRAGGGPPLLPSAHVLLHRDALDHLGYTSPSVGGSWLHFSLHLLAVFGSVGRYRRLEGVEVVEASQEAHEAAGRDEAAESGGPPKATPLRAAFERGTMLRSVDVHRVESLMLTLRLKSRSAFDGATAAYSLFAELYNANELVPAWPVLAEVLWGLLTVERSDDWALRDTVSPAMIHAAQDLQAQLLDRFGGAAEAADADAALKQQPGSSASGR